MRRENADSYPLGVELKFRNLTPSLRAQRSNPCLNKRIDGLLRYARNYVDRHVLAFSRRDTPEVCSKLPALQTEGAGNAGCALHPRSREQGAQKGAPTSIQGSGEHPTFPAQWLYGLYVISPENGSFASVAPWEIERLPDALTPAPRRQDHTTSPYASVALVSRTIRVHRIPVPRCDDGQRPSERDGMRKMYR